MPVTTVPEVVGEDVAKPLEGLPIGAKLVRFQHIHERGSPDAKKTAVYGVRSFCMRHCVSGTLSTCRCLEMLTTSRQFPKSYKWETGNYEIQAATGSEVCKLASELGEKEKLLHSNMHPRLTVSYAAEEDFALSKDDGGCRCGGHPTL